MTYSPKIYVASLSDYNAGNLHGAWIDADQDADEIQAEISEMLRGSKYPNVMVICPECVTNGYHDDGIGTDTTCEVCKGTGKVPSAEEWAIHDYSDFEGIKISEMESIERVAELAAGLSEHGEAFAVYIANFDRNGTPETFEDAYHGEATSAADFAHNFYAEQYGKDVTEGPLWNYIDWEAVARDMGYDGYSFEEGPSGTIYVFLNC